MFRPLKLNEFLNEVVSKEPTFKCVFLANSIDGSILATNDWTQKSFISNMCALWEDSNYIGSFKQHAHDHDEHQHHHHMDTEEAGQPTNPLLTQIINHDNGTVILMNICNNLLFGICSNKKDTNHAVLLQKAQNVQTVIENEVSKIIPQHSQNASHN